MKTKAKVKTKVKAMLIEQPQPSACRATCACSSVGDAGDAFVSLATIKHHGGIADYYLRDNRQTKGIVSRVHLVAPLIESQPYIAAVKILTNETVDWVSEHFRTAFVDRVTNLAGCHANHALSVGFIDTLPDFSKSWLTATPDKNYAGRIIINRSPRYQNPHFPWGRVIEHYGKRLVFFGMPDEHRVFCNSFGNVEYKPTKNFLEVAQAIAGSALIVANQSACMCVAEGLKHPRIQEGSLHIPDCIYPGATNAQYVFDGTVTLPDIGGSGVLELHSSILNWKTFDLPLVPKVKGQSGWQFITKDSVWLCESFASITAKKVAKANGWPYEKAHEEVIRYNVLAAPEFFKSRVNIPGFDVVKKALKNSGYTDHPVLNMATDVLANIFNQPKST